MTGLTNRGVFTDFVVWCVWADIKDPNDWRLKNGGDARCPRMFLPSHDQVQTGFFADSPDHELVMENLDTLLVYDPALTRSWYGRETSKLLAKFRAGQNLPLPSDPLLLEQEIVRLHHPNPQ